MGNFGFCGCPVWLRALSDGLACRRLHVDFGLALDSSGFDSRFGVRSRANFGRDFQIE